MIQTQLIMDKTGNHEEFIDNVVEEQEDYVEDIDFNVCLADIMLDSSSSIVVDDPVVLNLSDNIVLDQIPEIEGETTNIDETKVVVMGAKILQCSKCGEKISSECFFKFHVQSCNFSISPMIYS